jgi:hypothetical protein
MCDKCVELDGKIEHYRQIWRWVNDKATLEGIEVLIANYQSDKKASHMNEGLTSPGLRPPEEHPRDER